MGRSQVRLNQFDRRICYVLEGWASVLLYATNGDRLLDKEVCYWRDGDHHDGVDVLGAVCRCCIGPDTADDAEQMAVRRIESAGELVQGGLVFESETKSEEILSYEEGH
jgi:hypothetical protein